MAHTLTHVDFGTSETLLRSLSRGIIHSSMQGYRISMLLNVAACPAGTNLVFTIASRELRGTIPCCKGELPYGPLDFEENPCPW